jgi:hypothetical protein
MKFRKIHMEAGLSTFTVALRVLEGDEKGIVPGGYKYRNLALQVGESL